ncbi:hypothetical protein DM01DRAFT_1331614 [Hesseltinella vesiculosa]|uniref:Uncharacterized protein n=1 Tax=Hesseltinella vesiculosa TaxID=101127 RepID=A0A1X2GVU9_9FUNG|nr:hypothetical protein DM01DRAFT_1331613 [Hesseltinella vesiculosa]ORX62157.1 hypothetical protein DM01DRAFT_1331614 [Hesseltinella vesiculosa]
MLLSVKMFAIRRFSEENGALREQRCMSILARTQESPWAGLSSLVGEPYPSPHDYAVFVSLTVWISIQTAFSAST